MLLLSLKNEDTRSLYIIDNRLPTKNIDVLVEQDPTENDEMILILIMNHYVWLKIKYWELHQNG